MFGVLPPEMALQALRAECILAGDADPDTICGIVREEIHCSRIKRCESRSRKIDQLRWD
ncbi:hypothetical protein BDV33DRAFT_185752 [Aspergillus novoparasiticus]|uniref:Uncharacterized protein n=1 Tax=Aspergillus novoparasiticus TaxID=986946 RepID=A0A5N6E6T4_9EURO|nr:hypothetical protein BDV33DRAFT_185752 [Aspergillus novoparasiticus]